MKIRVAVDGDLICGLANCLAAFGVVDPFRDTNSPRKIVLVAEHNQAIVGTCSILLEEKLFHHHGKVAHIEDVAVLPAFQGQGIGKSLIDTAILTARSFGCYKAILCCSEENVGFYEKNGFRRHEVSMRLDLNKTH